MVPGPPLQVQPVPPSGLFATQRPALVSQRWLAEQAAQAAPAIPHWPFDWLAYVTQVWPFAQAAHAAPPVPQVPALEVRHMPLVSQQPLGHEDALQTHAPPAHA